VAELIFSLLQKELSALDPSVAVAFKPVLGQVLRRVDYAETGGAPLLGVCGVSIIAHGRSRAKAIVSGIRRAIHAAESGVVQATVDALPALCAAEQGVIEKELS
jgi:glycerol-3-phosphate acyltransferase PlsX